MEVWDRLEYEMIPISILVKRKSEPRSRLVYLGGGSFNLGNLQAKTWFQS